MRRISVWLVLVGTAGLVADDGRGVKLNDGQKAFQGTWTIVEAEKAKKDEPVTARTVEFRGNKYLIRSGDQVIEEGTFEANARKTPNVIRVEATSGPEKGKKWHGVYELEGNTLRAVVGPVDKPLPEKLVEPEKGQRAFTLQRKAASDRP